MKNPIDFIKLLDLNIPDVNNFDYYKNQLKKTQRYENIDELIRMFVSWNPYIEDIKEYKKTISNKLIESFRSTNAYNELCYDKSITDLTVSGNIQYSDKLKYLSITLRDANWAALKRYDPPQINELGSSCFDFFHKYSAPEIFAKSKYLRQYILANIDPKKLLRVQRNLIQELIRQYQDLLSLEGVKYDEVIFSFVDFTNLKDVLPTIDGSKYDVKIFTTQRVDDFRIDTIFNDSGQLLHREPIGLDDSKYYIKLKQYITNEPLDIKDLYFKQGNEVALWIVDGLKISF